MEAPESDAEAAPEMLVPLSARAKELITQLREAKMPPELALKAVQSEELACGDVPLNSGEARAALDEVIASLELRKKLFRRMLRQTTSLTASSSFDDPPPEVLGHEHWALLGGDADGRARAQAVFEQVVRERRSAGFNLLVVALNKRKFRLSASLSFLETVEEIEYALGDDAWWCKLGLSEKRVLVDAYSLRSRRRHLVKALLRLSRKLKLEDHFEAAMEKLQDADLSAYEALPNDDARKDSFAVFVAKRRQQSVTQLRKLVDEHVARAKWPPNSNLDCIRASLQEDGAWPFVEKEMQLQLCQEAMRMLQKAVFVDELQKRHDVSATSTWAEVEAELSKPRDKATSEYEPGQSAPTAVPALALCPCALSSSRRLCLAALVNADLALKRHLFEERVTHLRAELGTQLSEARLKYERILQRAYTEGRLTPTSTYDDCALGTTPTAVDAADGTAEMETDAPADAESKMDTDEPQLEKAKKTSGKPGAAHEVILTEEERRKVFDQHARSVQLSELEAALSALPNLSRAITWDAVAEQLRNRPNLARITDAERAEVFSKFVQRFSDECRSKFESFLGACVTAGELVSSTTYEQFAALHGKEGVWLSVEDEKRRELFEAALKTQREDAFARVLREDIEQAQQPAGTKTWEDVRLERYSEHPVACCLSMADASRVYESCMKVAKEAHVTELALLLKSRRDEKPLVQRMQARATQQRFFMRG